MTWKLWLDDQLEAEILRATPSGFLGAKSSQEAKNLVHTYGMPVFMDLDHDLGGEDTAMIFLHWLAENYYNDIIPEYEVHSENVLGRKNIISFMESWKKSQIM